MNKHGFVRIESWGGSHVVPVEIVAETPKRYKIRFLKGCLKGAVGAERYVAKNVVSFTTS